MHGLRALVKLSEKKEGEYITIRELSDDLDISFFFLTKILQRLTKAEILESYKGPNGGVRLQKPSDEISFMDVVLVIDGAHSLNECALGLPGCGVLKPCPLHDQWAELKGNMMEMMQTVTMAELAHRNQSDKPAKGRGIYREAGQDFFKSK
jgi:Rrf2 family transcriptional regulator, iron-sulfur cluster assembly transcription factor